MGDVVRFTWLVGVDLADDHLNGYDCAIVILFHRDVLEVIIIVDGIVIVGHLLHEALE